MFKKITGLSLPLFFIWPVGGFFIALTDIRSKFSAIVYVAFAMLFGYAISFSDNSADSYRYAQAFGRFDNTLDYNTIVWLYQNGELRDLYRLLLFYFVSLFSNNPKVMFACAGLVYGIFSYLCLRVFVKERGEKKDKYIFVLILVFYTYCSLSNINGFRFWTGALVLFYSTYNCIIQKKMGWIFGILVAPLFHYGFIIIAPVLIIYKLIESTLYNNVGVRPILFYVFVFSFFASWVLETNSINLSFLSQTDIVSGAVGDRMDYVNSADVANLVEKRRDNSLFLGVQMYFDYAIKIYVFISILYLRKLLKRMEGNRIEYTRFFSFVLFFYSVAFLATSIPSGGRFLYVAHLFMFLLLAKFYSVNNREDFKKLIIWALPVFSFNIVFINGLLPILILIPTFWYGNFFWIIIQGLDFYL